MSTFKRFLPNRPIIENTDFSIYGDDELIPYIEDILTTLSQEKKKLLDLLGIKAFPKIEINLFNSHETYLEFTRQFYEPAPYSRGNFTNGMINYSYEIKRIKNLIYSLRHELTHLLYESIWKNNYERVLWLDEGLAQNLSGEKGLLKKAPTRFKDWYLDRILRRDKEIPSIDFLREHGNTYGKFEDMETRRYSGYDLSYLMIRYLIETMSLENFQSLLRDIEKIKDVEKIILENALKYFNQQLEIYLVKDDFNDISTPRELMDYMNKNIVYGWLDVDKHIHINNLKDFRELYRVNSLKDILSLRIGTCIEQAKLIKYAFERMGLENKLYCYRKYETETNNNDEIKMHCFVAFLYEGKWYHFEHSNFRRRGIHEFNTLEELLERATSPKMDEDIQVLTEIPDLPDDLSFKELNDYINSFEPIGDFGTKKGLN